jgi:hypothetical protein
MTHHQLRARDCLRLARLFLACGIVLLAGAIFTGPSWLSLVLAVIGVQALNLAAAEYSDRRYHLNRCKN